MKRGHVRALRRRALALGVVAVLVWGPAIPALAAPAAPPAQEGPVTLTADHIEYNTQTGDVAAEGHIRATRGDTVITGDHLQGNLRVGEVAVSGNVTLIEGRRSATGTFVRYNYRTRVGRMDQGVTQYGPWNIKAQEFDTTVGQSTVSNGAITPCDPRHPLFLVTARQVVIVPDDYLIAYDASLFVYGVRVITLPRYTVSLKPGGGKSGPSLGYDKLNGAWIEYTQVEPMGSFWNQLRVRFGTLAGWSGEDILSMHVADHTLDLALGRTQTFDQTGNLFSFDREQAEIVYDGHRIPGIPMTYVLEGRVGNYYESQSGIRTTRAEAVLNLTSDTMPLMPRTTWAYSATARYDAYGSGQGRSVLGGSAAATYDLRGGSSLTMTYNFASVTGTSPFAFDGVGSDSAVGLSYTFGGGGLLQFGSVYLTYDFITLQTSVGSAVSLVLSPSIQFSVSGSYNTTLRQWNEIDYSVNVRCDCLALGVLYQTFPQNQAQNTFYITLGITTLPETFNTFKF